MQINLVLTYNSRLRKAGFTLIEVMLAVLILTFGIIAVHQAFGRCISAVRYCEDKLYCSFLTEKKVSELVLSSSKSAAEQAGQTEDAAVQAPGYTLKDEVRVVTRGKEDFMLHSLTAQGPSGAKLETFLLTPVPTKNE